MAEPEIDLTAEQRYVVKLAGDGCNIFVTGLAGSGKSTLIAEIQKMFTNRNRKFFTTAPTGVAAINIKGSTLHSFAGVGIAEGDNETCYRALLKNRKSMTWWQECQTLIIDEVSMLSPFLLPKLDYMAGKIRGREGQFFGGIQIIAVGDFFQLPPIIKDEVNPTGLEFVFELPLWKDNMTRCVHLSKVHRQKDDEFIHLLSEIRQGRLTEGGLKLLKSRFNVKIDCPDGIQPTKLFPTRAEAQVANNSALAQLPGEMKEYVRKQNSIGMIPFRSRESVFKKLDTDFPGEVTLKLKVDAQVMLLVNLDVGQGLCNGSRGVVTSIDETTGFPMVKFTNGETILVKPYTWEKKAVDKKWTAFNVQIPLKLAYGITIHKSQGLTIDRLEICLTKSWEPGQGYVALSRGKTLAGLSLTGSFGTHIFEPHPKVVEYYDRIFPEKKNTLPNIVPILKIE